MSKRNNPKSKINNIFVKFSKATKLYNNYLTIY